MLRERGDRALAVAVETFNVESAEAWLKQRLEHTTIAMRVGAVLYRRNLRVEEIVDGWEATNGEVDKEQFRRNIRALDKEAVGARYALRFCA